MRPKILVCVLCGTERQNWLNPILAMNLLTMARDSRFDVAFQPVTDYRPWEFARNQTIHLARSMSADWLISFDNDNFTYTNPLDVITAAGADRDVIGLTSGVGVAPECVYFPFQNHGPVDGAFREEQKVGGGVLMIRSRVWQKIPRGPWFKWQHSDTELLTCPDPSGADEVTGFCNLVREHGFRVWTHREVLAGHLKTSDVTRLAGTLTELSGGKWAND